MPKNAILGTNLVDSLITDVIDSLRDELHADFGVRAYEVSLVTRVWDGGEVGEGLLTDTEEILVPRPLVKMWRLGFEQEPCGLDEAGFIQLKEVSLAYNHDDILACQAPVGTEYLFKVTEGHGQGNPVRYFIHERPPFVDRVQDMSWVVWLVHTEVICP